MEVSCVRERELVLTIADTSLDGLVVIVDPGIGDEVVDAVHLHRDLLVDRDLATYYGVTKRAVITRNGGVR